MSLKDHTKITQAVRDAVLDRDSYDGAPCCIVCGSPNGIELHHFVERSRGGMGVESNLVCLCAYHHRKLHDGDRAVKVFCEQYLAAHYEGWAEDKQIYRRQL